MDGWIDEWSDKQMNGTRQDGMVMNGWIYRLADLDIWIDGMEG